jgi:hypothetical protein
MDAKKAEKLAPLRALKRAAQRAAKKEVKMAA